MTGIYDADGNEVPKAYIVRRPGAAELSEDEVMAFVAERVAPYKKIRRVAFVAGVPRAASGKILRCQLREPREPYTDRGTARENERDT